MLFFRVGGENMAGSNKKFIARISENGQVIIPDHVLKALGISPNGQLSIRLVQKDDHFIAELEEASLAAKSRNEAALDAGKRLVEKMTQKYGNTPKRDAMADERGSH
jgi:bifunctional DNA-binding transcriptional regulator/antitoxin component of YhaV-PrlF toxin-antitoxin module